MNFFQHQDRARRKTGLLVGLLVAAVTCLIAVTILSVGFFLYFIQRNSTSLGAMSAQQETLLAHFWQLLHSPLTAWISLTVILVVGAGCVYKFFQLGSGGEKVATSLGGRLIDSNTRDPLQRKVLNVVEEMAIASGNPVPSVYLIEETGINAFAAGLNRRDAVIGVTRGCIKLLNRDELQGVIAHEFSHIHNGDMRLNMRLIALLHGILLIGLIGYYIAHGTGYARSGRGRRDGRQLSLGLTLMAIGYGGTFFGNIIKAAVSRQREFLADASAVQFTRNPSGISGALQKIGGFSHGSTIANARAAEFSHLYFGQGIKTAFSNMMATHPPLAERVMRIDPRWQGSFPEVADQPVYDATNSDAVSHFSQPASDGVDTSDILDDGVLDIVGDPCSEHVKLAERLIDGLPETLHTAAQDAFSARAVIYGLLLDVDPNVREAQFQKLQNSAHPVSYKILMRVFEDILKLPRQHHLALLSVSIPALKRMSSRQYDVFRKNLVHLIRANEGVSLFEWSLYRIVTKTLEAIDVPSKYHLAQLKNEATALVAATSHAGNNHDPLAAFNIGMDILGYDRHTTFPKRAASLSRLDHALDKLEALKALEKPRLLKALIAVINADNVVTANEQELFRAVADTLDCPVPLQNA